MVNIYLNRLSIHPFKWIRYVMFSVFTSLAGVIDLYYNPSGSCIFVDYNGLNETLTSTDSTPCRHDFRDEVIKRDGESCTITGQSADICDAAHIIPRCKSDEVVFAIIVLPLKVVEDRWDLYDPRPPPIDGVNDIQNGVLLKADLHRLLSIGYVALLKTPNYGLDPTDIRRFE
ncbi:hypothetical protein EDB83DRAFT_2362411 [Lactarius deliciosus]|nr:hypothetical protein EDB83DRAFT_2362411 [Lactarius deliciosus]